jgi:hypothetical protein
MKCNKVNRIGIKHLKAFEMYVSEARHLAERLDAMLRGPELDSTPWSHPGHH